MSNIKQNKKSGGFSLLELVLAVAIFSLGAIAMVTLLIDSNISTRLSSERTNALLYAKEGVSAVRSIRDNSWANLEDGYHGLISDGVNWSFSGASDLIDSSAEVDDNKYERIVSVIASSTATSTKDVSVTVTWDLTPSREASVVLQTILTNWNQ